MMMLELECNSNNNKRKRGKKEKRRFSDEQIRYLDSIFESKSKLDPRKKLEVARKLDLQPRQVAIWFQNKRARCKSKHIEKEYSLLLSHYNNLSAHFHTLNTHNQSLQTQLNNLKKEMRGREGGSDGESESNKIVEDQFEVKKDGIIVSDDDSNSNSNSNSNSIDINAEFLQSQLQLQLRDEDELLRMVETTSDWGTLDSDDIIINQTSSQWWGFWS